MLKFALRERVSGASSLVCTRCGTYPGARFGSMFEEQVPSCVLVGVLTRERVSGASSLVCAGLKTDCFIFSRSWQGQKPLNNLFFSCEI